MLGEISKEFTGSSNNTILNQLKLSHLENLTPEKLKAPSDFNDVRETAERHVKALLTPKAGGERILSVGYVLTLQDFRKSFIFVLPGRVMRAYTECMGSS